MPSDAVPKGSPRAQSRVKGGEQTERTGKHVDSDSGSTTSQLQGLGQVTLGSLGCELNENDNQTYITASE